MKDLACGQGPVAMGCKVVGQADVGFQELRFLGDMIMVVVKPGRGRPTPPQQTDPRGVAHGALAMGVGEEHPTGREAVNVRSLRLRVSVEAPHPVVEVVDCDEEDIGPTCRDGSCHHQEKRKPADEFFHFGFSLLQGKRCLQTVIESGQDDNQWGSIPKTH